MRKQIKLGQFVHMEIDESDGRLYWKGKPIVTEQAIRLQTLERWFAAAAAFATVVVAIVAVGRAIGDWH